MKRVWSIQPPRCHAAHVQFGSRIALLVLCVIIGAAVGFVGRSLTGSDAWFLAIPLCVAVGWFVVADPSACAVAPPARSDDGPPAR